VDERERRLAKLVISGLSGSVKQYQPRLLAIVDQELIALTSSSPLIGREFMPV